MNFHQIDQDMELIGQQRDNVKDFIASINVDKIENIKEVMDEITTMIAERKDLSSVLIMSCDKVLSSTSSIISRIPPEALREEIQLHAKVLEIEELKIREKLECWRDVARLKQELREHLAEFRDQESKQNSLSSLLED